jgi:hypothetical protein
VRRTSTLQILTLSEVSEMFLVGKRFSVTIEKDYVKLLYACP